MMMSLTSPQVTPGTAHGNPYLDKSQCRTCLAAMDRGQHYLFEQVAIGDDMVQTASIIMACASVQILVNDFYPQYICRTCLNDAIKSYAFRSKCELSQQRLLEASHVGTLKVETTTHLPTLQAAPFKVETVDTYEVDVNREHDGEDDGDIHGPADSDDDDFVPSDVFGGEVSSDDEVLAKKVEKRSTRSTPTRKRRSITPSRLLLSNATSAHICRQCDAIFPTRPAFIAHRDTHASFICRWCPGAKIAFASYETLLAHMRKKHKDEYQKQGEMHGGGLKDDEVMEEKSRSPAKRRRVTTVAVKSKAKRVAKKVKKKLDVDVIKTEELDEDDENDVSAEDDPHQSITSTAHQCHYCYKYYTSSTTLTKHISHCPSSTSTTTTTTASTTTTDPTKFTCNVCSRHFRTFRAVTEHKRTHKGGVFCPYCGLHMLARSMVNHRKREHGSEKEAVCEMCSGVYRGVDELENHLVSHKVFSCSHCSFGTKYIDEYRLHLLSHDLKTFAEDENGKCIECGEQTADTLALIQHYKIHTMVTCQECETNYGNVVHLYQHKMKAHSDIDTTIPEEKRKCTVCAKQFLTVEGMWQHRAKHNVESGKDGETTGELFCAYCDFRPKSNVSLGKHMQEEHHSQKTETCSVCDKSFFSAGKLKVHMLTHNADKQHVCEVCGAGFALKGNLNVHMRVHTGEKPYKCEICGYLSNSIGHYKSHLEFHGLAHAYISEAEDSHRLRLLAPKISQGKLSGKIQSLRVKSQIVYHCKQLDGSDVYMCKSCELVYTSKDDLKQHMTETHTSDAYSFQCLICNKFFNTKDNLKQHLKKIHDNNERERSMQTCSVCGKQLLNRQNLKIHMFTHTGEKPFKCRICDYRCAQNGSLNVHMRIHNPTRFPVSMCEVCGKPFTHKSHYYLHMRTVHSDERPHACNQCDLKFKDRETLKGHMLIHTNIRTHVCPFCGKAFKRRSSLTVHVKIHTGERPHVCPTCGKGFLQKHVRDSHMKVHEASRN